MDNSKEVWELQNHSNNPQVNYEAIAIRINMKHCPVFISFAREGTVKLQDHIKDEIKHEISEIFLNNVGRSPAKRKLATIRSFSLHGIK